MSDRSPSLIPTEVDTISIMSVEALGIDDGGGIGTLVGALQGNSAVPDLNVSTSAAPSLVVPVTQRTYHRFCTYPEREPRTPHVVPTVYQVGQVGETAAQARFAG